MDENVVKKTKKKIVEENENEVVTPSQMREAKKDFIFELPNSKIKVLVRPPKLFDLIEKDIFTYSLISKMESVDDLSGDFTKMKNFSDSDFKSMMSLFYRFATIAIIQPRVMFDEDALKEGLTEDEYVPPSFFDFPDLIAIWELTMGRGQEMSPFRTK